MVIEKGNIIQKYVEITTAEEYNKKYKVKVGENPKKKKNKENETYKLWMSLSEEKQLKFSKSYMTFIDFIEIYKK